MDKDNNKITPELMQSMLSLQTWKDFFAKTPCVRSSFLWGVGVSSLMAAHKLRLYRGNVSHVMNATMLTFTAVTGMSFMICAYEVNTKQKMLAEAVAKANDQSDRPTVRRATRSFLEDDDDASSAPKPPTA